MSRTKSQQRVQNIRSILEIYIYDERDLTEAEQNRLLKDVLAEGKRINQNMRAMRNANVTGVVYDRTMQFLKNMGRNTFPEKGGAIDNVEDLIEYAQELQSIAGAKTLTLRGERQYRRKLGKMFKRGKGSAGISEAKMKDFEIFLSSEIWDIVKKYDSSRIYDVADALEEGKDIEDLNDLFEKYENGQMSADEAIETWATMSEEEIEAMLEGDEE